MFSPIDLKTWERREYYEHYMSAVPCTYSMSVKLDVTDVRRKKIKMFPALLYALSKAVNGAEEFRCSLENGVLGRFDKMHPCYTVFHEETETFSNLWTEYCEDFAEFCRRVAEDKKNYGGNMGMNAKPDVPENHFTVSVIPWESFEGFHLDIGGFGYLRPIFTAGKFYEENGRILLPLAVQVHHAVCDGFHVCRLIGAVRGILQEL